MTIKKAARSVLMLAVLVAGFSLAQARQQPKPAEGDAPYIPSRLEWLSVTLNADLRDDALSRAGYYLSVGVGGSDTIEISVMHFQDVDKELMDMAIKHARETAMIHAQKRGWTSWLKVSTRIKELVDPGPDK